MLRPRSLHGSRQVRPVLRGFRAPEIRIGRCRAREGRPLVWQVDGSSPNLPWERPPELADGERTPRSRAGRRGSWGHPGWLPSGRCPRWTSSTASRDPGANWPSRRWPASWGARSATEPRTGRGGRLLRRPPINVCPWRPPRWSWWPDRLLDRSPAGARVVPPGSRIRNLPVFGGRACRSGIPPAYRR